MARLNFSVATVKKIQDVFVSEMNKGIHQQPSSLQMENTYVPELLDGTGCCDNLYFVTSLSFSLSLLWPDVVESRVTLDN